MISQEAELLQFHLQALAGILYRNIPSSERTSVEDIEKALRRQVLDHASQQIAIFLSDEVTGTKGGK